MRLWITMALLAGVAMLFGCLWVLVYGRKEPRAWRRGIGLAIFGFVSAMAVVYFSYWFPFGTQGALYEQLFPINLLTRSWFGAMGLLLVPLACLAVVRWLVMRKAERMTPEQAASRRSFFRALAVALPALSFIGVAKTTVDTMDTRIVKPLTLRFQNLPLAMEKYKIGQISDYHLGPYTSVEELHRVFQELHGQGVDQVVITGDLVDSIPMLPGLAEVLRFWTPQFRDGVTYIYGNHEYYRDFKRVQAVLEDTPIRILRNSHYRLPIAGDTPVYMVGVDFPFHQEQLQEEMESFLDEAMAGVPDGAFVILLAHHPDFIGCAFARQIPLTLAGHSHGGQVNIGQHVVLPLSYSYWRDLYRAPNVRAGQSLGYVSTGAGDWWPFRVDCPREITIFTLEKGRDTNPTDRYEKL